MTSRPVGQKGLSLLVISTRYCFILYIQVVLQFCDIKKVFCCLCLAWTMTLHFADYDTLHYLFSSNKCAKYT